MREVPLFIETDARLAGLLCLPEDAGKRGPIPGMILLGGTGGDTRDGDINPKLFPEGKGPPQRGTLRRIAHSLALAGVATLRFDKRGVGESSGTQDASDYDTDLVDNIAAFRALQARPEIDVARVGVAGHSAGAFNACLVCRDVPEVACAGLLGALYGPIDELIRWNWPRIAHFWDQFTDAQRAWLLENRPREVVQSFGTETFLEAMNAGVPEVELSALGMSYVFNTTRARQDHLRPVADEFRHVRCPALILHGGSDLNVKVEDCLGTYQALKAGGNENVDLVVVPRTEHSFLEVPADPVQRAWERISLESWSRPMSPVAPATIASWAARVLGVGV